MHTVLITGATRKIGACIARWLHRSGMDVILHFNRSAHAAHQLAEELNLSRENSAMTVQQDLLKIEGLASLCERAIAFKNQVTVLVNNAAVFYPLPIASTSSQDWDAIMSVNLKGPFFLAQTLFKKQSGLKGIINIADIHAERPLQDHSVYSISQAGMLMLTKVLAKEFGPAIRANTILPGAITWPDTMNEHDKAMILKKISLGRSGTPSDIAKAVFFLIEEANYMTGQHLVIDGGRTLYS